MNRRDFMKTSSAGLVGMSFLSVWSRMSFAAGAGAAGVGICDWTIGEAAKPEAIPKAKKLHLDGIQVSVGTDPDNIPLRDKAVRKKYIEMGKRYGIVFHSVAAGGILNRIPLATEPQSAVYVIDAIEAAKALGAKNILIAFFGNGDLRLRDENGKFRKKQVNGFTEFELDRQRVKKVVQALRQIAPRAEDAGVVLGLENTLTAKQNLEIIDQIGSKMAQVYYDVGNSTGNGYNVVGELRLLGNDRICEVHLKDKKSRLLGSPEGEVDMKGCARALADIGYDKWLVLETRGRKGHYQEDTLRNVAFVRKTFVMAK